MQTIRSFIALPITAAIQKSAAGLVRRLSGERDGIKWVPGENLHLTLKFLGEVDNRELPKVCATVRDCCRGIPPFALEFRGAGAFPDPSRPRVVYAGIVEGGEVLRELVGRLEPALADLGFKPEPRDYVPHLTLGRTRGGSRRGAPEVGERIRAAADVELGSMLAEKVCLYASFLDKTGPTYQVMDTIEL
ncbi:RNA 2',3'-cyclic phosphodiesterase [Candidatus Laterigemmans baculatus]|uniref:RNA 2',3'-cyclic phosphodiesterase n=1 Tax=Candidatus Laterigemmans baculatus TaxID=2770505 RepID=UPI0013DB345B|nr:RNA 2',3'-cyclic phosphodiesterase [Candidatus Laterigemmans baculatus]